MIKIIFIILILYPLVLISNFQRNCETESIFFVNKIDKKQIEVSSFYCDFWKTIFIENNNKIQKNIWLIIKYDYKTKTISKPNTKEIKEYINIFKEDLKNTKKSSLLKSKIYTSYIINYRDYENNLSNFLKSNIFSKEESNFINNEIEKQPYKIFENTYWKRLLMNWKIISRENWGAQENYAHKEVYEKKCHSWNCWSQATAPKVNQIRQNYINNFLEIDKKNKITTTFKNGRDPINYYPVERIVIHHTAWGFKKDLQEWLSYMKALHKYHALTLWWWDIWYHYLIDWQWNIYEWRAWWKYALWAHAIGHNYWSVWISLMSDGDYTEEMLKSLKDLVIYLGKEYNLDLTKKTLVRNWDLTWYEIWRNLVAHKELDSSKPKDPEIDMNNFRKEIIHN